VATWCTVLALHLGDGKTAKRKRKVRGGTIVRDANRDNAVPFTLLDLGYRAVVRVFVDNLELRLA